MKILGIESSCDETAAAIITENKTILSNVIYSQLEEHKKFYGVVPEIAARAHLEKIDVIVNSALKQAQLTLSDLDAIAGTCGPGLIGGIIVGATFAKTLAMVKKIPFIAINHIEAHAISVRLTENIEFPYLLLLASGGHCQICVVYDINHFKIIGKTVDDSIGESFDKVSKLLGFDYPGGPIIEKNAKLGNATRFPLPHPLCNKNSLDFSFSGLKTAVRIIFEKYKSLQDRLDICASFQKTATDILVYKIKQAFQICSSKKIPINAIVIAGGVAANQEIRTQLQFVSEEFKLPFFAPPIALCTDNAAMIAWLGIEKLQKNQTNALNFQPHPRWPLSETC